MTKFILFYAFIMAFPYSVNGQSSQLLPKIADAQGNENPLIDCDYPLNGNCLNLFATYPQFFQATTYEVQSINFEPVAAFDEGTPLNVDADDLFIKKVMIPFSFCFFGKSYDELVVSSNGLITFNSSQLGNISYPNMQAQNPDISLPLNTIFGVAQDLVFSADDDSEIYYSVVGTAPYRKMVINFYKGRMVGCDQSSTSQIVLNEGSNDIEIYVDEKPLPCSTAKFKESLIGILNNDGTVGFSPTDRNTGIWTASKEAWRFKANGKEVAPQISWYNSENQNIGSGKSVTVCPEKNETYSVKVSYALCGNNNFELRDDCTVSFASDFPLAKSFTKVLCGNAPLNINLDDYLSQLTPQLPQNLLFSFHISLAEAQNNQNPQPKIFELDDNTTFYVRVQNPNDPNCYRTCTLKLNLISKSLISDQVEICDTNNDGVEKDYLLSEFNKTLFNLPLNGTVHYFKSRSDAENGENELLKADITDNSQFFISYEAPGCTQVFGPITIKFKSSPQINSPIDFPYTTCDLKNDHVEPFDFDLFLSHLIATDPTFVFSYYGSYAEAFSGNGTKLTKIKEGRYTIYVRVEIPGGCFSIATVNLEVTFTKIEAKDSMAYICFDGMQDIDVNLDDYTGDMLIDPLVGITKTYYAREVDGEQEVNPISNLQKLTKNGSFVSNLFFVRFSNAAGCYALKNLTINLVHPEIAKSQFDICDFKNDNTENVILSSLTRELIGSQSATVTFYLNPTDAASGTNSIPDFMLINSKKLYVKIVAFGCSEIYEINLQLVSTPEINENITIIRNSVCDNNNDSKENVDLTLFQSQIYSGPKTPIFKFYTSYNAADNSLSGLIANPTAFSVQGVSRVYAQVTFTDGKCYSVSTIDITLNFLPAIVLKKAVLARCDFDFNLNEAFNLEDAIPQLFDPAVNTSTLDEMDISFFETEADANTGDLKKQIKSPFITKDSNVTVWARFSSNVTHCYSTASVNLKTYLPPKALRSTIDNICDENLDGNYDVNLLNFTSNMAVQTSTENHFQFYYTEADANSKVNEIKNPENFSANPLPAKLWVRIENIPGCFDVASFDFKLGTKIPLKNYGPLEEKVCDTGNDGVEAIDLTTLQSEIYTGTATFEYFTSVEDLNNYQNLIKIPKSYSFAEDKDSKIYVKVSTPAYCPEMVVINLSLKTTPMFSLPDYYFCPESSVDVQPDFSGLDIASFHWEDPSGKIISTTNEILKVNIEGTYKINVISDNGCTFSTQFQVKKYEVPVIKDLIFNGNSATVISTGSETILYSIDGITYQVGNVFDNLPNGVVTFYVKFADSSCAAITKKGLILKVNNAFSPNGDGVNDTWIIDNLDVFEGQKTNVKVFDRYQKLIFQQESNTKIEWDGKVEKRGISTDSYWYVITLPDGRVVDGWVLLKNRN